ncbi:MAG: hypothetical protein LUE21_07950, partial [Oscillospiraceae bacterium]|nr:hypothetical protein [Oscillospiraceae bacterium]
MTESYERSGRKGKDFLFSPEIPADSAFFKFGYEGERKMKRILSLLLAVALVFALMAVPVVAADDEELDENQEIETLSSENESDPPAKPEGEDDESDPPAKPEGEDDE